MTTKIFKIDPAESIIEWTGKKVTGAHNGTIDISMGALEFTDDELTGGEFSIDTTTIKILDVTDPATNKQFADHLFSDDFFATDRFPEAKFKISSVYPIKDNRYDVFGDLMIKGINSQVNFDADVRVAGNKVTATGKIVIDRTRYDIRFRSGNFFQNLGDTLIYNDFELNVILTASINS